MKKLDFKKDLKHLYQPGSRDFAIVDVPPMNFLMIDGQGNPNTAPAYTQALEALYAVAYALKFICKREYSVDFTVGPPEGLWWTADMGAFSLADKDAWLWTMMIMQPEPVTAALAARAIEETRRKKALPALDRLRFETYHEGLSVQIMHIGPYEAEAPTLARLHDEYLPAHGLAPAGKHHEIYLSDPRRTAPEKMRTILRQPVQRIAEDQPGNVA